MAEKLKIVFEDNAHNTYFADQVVLDEKDGRKVFHTGNGGVEVTPISGDVPSDEVWSALKNERETAKSDSSASAKPPVT